MIVVIMKRVMNYKKYYSTAEVVCMNGTAHCEWVSGELERCVKILDEILKK